MPNDLFGNTPYPERPGYKEPTTSKAAAIKIAGTAKILQERILRELVGADLTPDECAARLDESVLAVRPRFTELASMGRIERSGERRKNDSGMSAAVWKIKSS